jgi:hypothetical protein
MDSATYVATMNTWIAALPTFVSDANALAANLNSIAAGGAYAIPYTFDINTTVSDPGNGKMRMNQATLQYTATTLVLDDLGSDGTTHAGDLDNMDASSSVVKGAVRIVKVSDPTKWQTFNVTAVGRPGGYHTLTVVNVGGSSSSPFVNGDAVLLYFQRTGDIGPPGTLVRRVTSVASNTAPNPNIATTDLYVITALAGSLTIGAPTGTPSDGQGLMYRIKDNGVARTIAYNAIYRASVELPFPSTTVVGKTLYLGFIYNAADTKWDLIAAINNM